MFISCCIVQLFRFSRVGWFFLVFSVIFVCSLCCDEIPISGQSVKKIIFKSKRTRTHTHTLCSGNCDGRGFVLFPISLSLVRLRGIFRFLQLHLQSLGADLKAVHRLDGRKRRIVIVERHETEALRQVRLLVDKHFGRNDVAERQKRRRQIGVGELLRQMVDEQVGTVRSCVRWCAYGWVERGHFNWVGVIRIVCVVFSKWYLFNSILQLERMVFLEIRGCAKDLCDRNGCYWDILI